MKVTGDEVVFFHGDDLNVTCTGCITKPEFVTTPATTKLSTSILPQQTTSSNLDSGRSSSTKPKSTTTNREQTSSDLNLKTSSESTTTNLNVGQTSSDQSCDLNLNEADFISRTEYEEKLNQTYAMFGGIIAGIIIINIVTIGIYCFISKRNKDGTSPDNEYANTQFRQPGETESPQYQGLNI